LLKLNAAVYGSIEYVPESSRVDSPVDEALRNRKGVCQDYSHIVIALVRQEAYQPQIGWTGFDATTNTTAGETHVRTQSAATMRTFHPPEASSGATRRAS